MSISKAALSSALFLTLLWLLYPSRSNDVTPGTVEITYMGPGGPISGPMEDAVRAFEKESEEAHAINPSKPIYKVVSGQNASRDQIADPTRLLVSMAGGTPPDVVWFDRYAVTEWASKGAFRSLNSFMDEDQKVGNPDRIRQDEYFPASWSEVTHTDQKIYGIPTTMNNRALFYNKDFLIRAGYVDAKGEARPPKTWEELEEMSSHLNEFDENGKLKRIGFIPNYDIPFFYMWSWMNGGELLSHAKTQCTMNSPENIEAMEFITRIFDQAGGAQKVMAFQSGFQKGALDPFLTGKMVMKIDGFLALNGSLAQYGSHINYGVAPPPIAEKELKKGLQSVSWTGGWCYAIPSLAKHPEAAWEFIRFMNSSRALSIIAESEKLTQESQGLIYIPQQICNRVVNDQLLRKYVLDNPNSDAKVVQGIAMFNSLLKYSRFRPVSPVAQFLFNQQVDAMNNSIFHKMLPKEALDHATTDVQRELDKILHPRKTPKVPWKDFLIIYVILLMFIAFIVYQWDTRTGFRRRFLKWFPGTQSESENALENNKRGFFRHQWVGGFVCALPWIVGFVVFTGGPILFSIIISFCEYDIFSPARWAGFENYRWMFFEDPLFWKSLSNTLFWLLIVPLQMAVSLSMALLLNMKVKGVAFYRTFFYLPSIVPAVASSILWIWILNPNSGMINSVLHLLGLPGLNWLQDETTSKPSLMLMSLWGAGGGMIIWLAGLKSINDTYYEAAELDGASLWQKFSLITLPLLTPYIFFNLIMGLINAFQVFTQAFIMTQGGPVNSTLFYAYYLFNQSFRYLHLGYAAAMGWFLFLITLSLTMLQMKYSKKWVHYEGE